MCKVVKKNGNIIVKLGAYEIRREGATVNIYYTSTMWKEYRINRTFANRMLAVKYLKEAMR